MSHNFENIAQKSFGMRPLSHTQKFVDKSLIAPTKSPAHHALLVIYGFKTTKWSIANKTRILPVYKWATDNKSHITQPKSNYAHITFPSRLFALLLCWSPFCAGFHSAFGMNTRIWLWGIKAHFDDAGFDPKAMIVFESDGNLVCEASWWSLNME